MSKSDNVVPWRVPAQDLREQWPMPEVGDPHAQPQPGGFAMTEELLATGPQPHAGIAGIDHIEAFLNMRTWLEKACEAAGATVGGAGIGCGQADIDIELEGHRYNISIRPLRKPI